MGRSDGKPDYAAANPAILKLKAGSNQLFLPLFSAFAFPTQQRQT
jgi:hypothetical protein